MNIRDQVSVIVGGGHIATRKAELVAQAGARLRIVSPQFSPAMQRAAAHHAWDLIQMPFSGEHLAGAALVIAATDDPAVNQAVYQAATAIHTPVNVADQTELCSFILPAIVDRGPVTIAVSTGGASPVLARWIRTRLESTLPASLGLLADLLKRFRGRLKQHFTNIDARRRFTEALMEGPVSELALSGQVAAAEQALTRLLDAETAAVTAQPREGEVYLIGAGPGDGDLLTFRALRLLQRAEVVLYDRLVPESVLRLCRREAQMVYVGKQAGDHPVPQARISELLVEYASAGRRVARVKGGDPFIFGRGGEEIQHLSDAGIRFQVVPGISAANGCAAYAGIPLTHRDHAQGVSFWTAHHKDGNVDLNWPALADPRQTLVFYMGVGTAEIVCRELIAHGLPGDTPAAMIEQGTTEHQRVITADLQNLPTRLAGAQVRSPALMIVGQVVKLRDQLRWFEGNRHSQAPAFPQHRLKMDAKV